MYKKVKLIGLTMVASIIFLGGCSQSPKEELLNTLEDVAQAEQEFKNQQEPLVEIEKKEKEIYDQIIALSMKEFDQIKELSNEAIELVNERQDLMKNEEESITASQKEFEKTDKLINKIEDDDLKKSANELYDVMMQRYDVHSELYKHYMNSTEMDIELYELFKKEDVTLEQLESQIEKINQSYEKIVENNETFNEKTEEYNDKKLVFYKDAGIEIEEEKE
ncbi:YkyA family protein [Cytobacillus sp. Sa5YUA1]|uniref:YkyA family protein n=1 Tax=Cytobacillus stercorigallinarum TaxID=2762240 RepID=A0ABR8QMY2_9BACI|nr:YkyA family protein [Cytobacillus stercorigallinarum]MBD7936889.1 YkyA family protein [Cytobacillus stercorigallinarum]